MKNYSFALILLFFLVGCKAKTVKEHSIDFNFSNMTDQPVSNFVKSYRVIPLETNDFAYITKSKQIKVFDEQIFVLENISGRRHQLYRFSLKGKYLGKLNKQGRGPEEYQSISSFDMHPKNKTLSVLDPGLRKIKHYDFNSNYLGEQLLKNWGKEFCYILGNDKVYIATTSKKSRAVKDNSMELEILNEKNEVICSAFPFSKPVSIATGNDISFSGTSDDMGYISPNSNLVYSFYKDSIVLKHELNFPYPVLPGEELQNAFFKGKKILDNHVYNVIYFETPRMVYSQFMNDKKIYWGLYDKNSKESKLFPEEKDPSCNCGITLNVKGTYGDSLILETDYSKINPLLNVIDPGKKRCLNPGIFKEIEKLDMTSNPILILIEYEL